jgi:hypothetical protein
VCKADDFRRDFRCISGGNAHIKLHGRKLDAHRQVLYELYLHAANHKPRRLAGQVLQVEFLRESNLVQHVTTHNALLKVLGHHGRLSSHEDFV